MAVAIAVLTSQKKKKHSTACVHVSNFSVLIYIKNNFLITLLVDQLIHSFDLINII